MIPPAGPSLLALVVLEPVMFLARVAEAVVLALVAVTVRPTLNQMPPLLRKLDLTRVLQLTL